MDMDDQGYFRMLKESNAGEQRLMPPEQRSFRNESVFAQNAPRYLRRRAVECNLWPALGERMRLSEYYRDEIDAALKQNVGISLGVMPLPVRGSGQEEEDAWIESCDPAQLATTACQARLAGQRLKWQRLRAEPMAEGFFLLFWRLHLWSREQNPWTQEEAARRVCSIVDAASRDTVLREALFSYADGPHSCTEILETLVAALEKQVAAASF